MFWEVESRIGTQMADILTVLSSAELRNERRASSKLVFAFCKKKKKFKRFSGFIQNLPQVSVFCGLGASSEHPSFQSCHPTALPSPQMLTALTPPSSAPPPN